MDRVKAMDPNRTLLQRHHVQRLALQVPLVKAAII